MSFESLGLSAPVLQAVTEKGYTTPTPIQEKAIPIVLMGRDVLGCAQTGTGKTASFVLPMIDILAEGRAKARMPRSLILEPTRELAAQVAENFEIYGKYNKLNMALLIGGVSFADQERALEKGVDVLIATPGRLLDHFERGGILLNDVKILVIDEADRMLDMGFIPDVERIVATLPQLRQTLFFSATMPPEIKRLADRFLSNPKEVTVSPPATASATVVQGLVVVSDGEKRDALLALIKSQEVKNALVFCNRKRDVATLHTTLKKHGLNAGALHGDMSQPARTETLERFKAGEIHILVASDVAARGLDIVDMSHVFNYRRAVLARGLRASHRPHRPCRQDRPFLHPRDAGRRRPDRGDREADRHHHSPHRSPRARDHGAGSRRWPSPGSGRPQPWRTPRAAIAPRPASRSQGAARASRTPRASRAAVTSRPPSNRSRASSTRSHAPSGRIASAGRSIAQSTATSIGRKPDRSGGPSIAANVARSATAVRPRRASAITCRLSSPVSRARLRPAQGAGHADHLRHGEMRARPGL